MYLPKFHKKKTFIDIQYYLPTAFHRSALASQKRVKQNG